MTSRARATALVFLASATLTVAAESDRAAYVYTNADLERFGPPSAAPAPAPDEPAWDFVIDFLEREQARIDAERAHELERRLAGIAEAESERQSAPRYGYGFLPGYGIGHSTRVPVRHADRRAPAAARLGDRIVPLHARPSDAMRMRARAMQHSGVDAFPGNARRAD